MRAGKKSSLDNETGMDGTRVGPPHWPAAPTTAVRGWVERLNSASVDVWSELKRHD